MALDGKGGLYVTQSLSNRIVRVDLQHPEKVTMIADEADRGYRSVVATGLPTKTVGIGVPLMNYSSDVLVRRDGTVVVSGAADGSLVELFCSEPSSRGTRYSARAKSCHSPSMPLRA